MWQTDSKVDDTDLDVESLKIPTLLTEYYRGDLNNPDDLKEMDREPWPKVILKQEIGNYVDSDKDMMSLLSKIAYQEELVGCCEDILKSINNRGFQIRAAIDWRRLTQFGGA